MSSTLKSPSRQQNSFSQKYSKVIEILQSQNIQVLTEEDVQLGSNPWDIICPSDRHNYVLQQFTQLKTLGLGNAYAAGYWHCARLDLLFERLFALNLETKSNSILFELPNSPALILEQLLYKFFNVSLIKQHDVAKIHYDLPTKLYEGFLGESMKYTTGDWTGLEQIPENLNAAQRQNLEYWVEELQIEDGDIILDCGCGWGTLPQHLANRFDLTYIGITISDVQVDYCRSKFAEVTNFYFYNHSYHDRHEHILALSNVDRITKCIFLETIEHGGTKNWGDILHNIRTIITQDGLLGIQTNGADYPVLVSDPYINRYIFPHLALGSPAELGKAIEKNRQFIMCQQNNISQHYGVTWRTWNHYFQNNWSKIEPYIAKIIDSTPFSTTAEWKRHWEYFLLLCAGAYDAGTYPQLYQLTAKPNFFPS